MFCRVKFCKKTGKPLCDSTPQRIVTICEASQIRDDGLHRYLEDELAADKNFCVKYHKDCVSTYTSKHHLNRLPKRCGSELSSEAKRPRRSEHPSFDFLKHCIFCGEVCEEKDKKNPSRWRCVVLCRTAERGPKKLSKMLS